MSVAKLHPPGSRAEPHRTVTFRFPVAVLQELEIAVEESGLTKAEILVQAFTQWNNEREKAH